MTRGPFSTCASITTLLWNRNGWSLDLSVPGTAPASDLDRTDLLLAPAACPSVGGEIPVDSSPALATSACRSARNGRPAPALSLYASFGGEELVRRDEPRSPVLVPETTSPRRGERRGMPAATTRAPPATLRQEAEAEISAGVDQFLFNGPR